MLIKELISGLQIANDFFMDNQLVISKIFKLNKLKPKDDETAHKIHMLIFALAVYALDSSTKHLLDSKMKETDDFIKAFPVG